MGGAAVGAADQRATRGENGSVCSPRRGEGNASATYPSLANFAWQEGYSAFSVSKSQEDAVKVYITKQREHHQEQDFKSELIRLLEAHAINVDKRYVFD
jgi:hypothetical protein